MAILQKAHKAFAESVPWPVVFVTCAVCPLVSSGTEYQDAVVASQYAGVPAGIPSMSAQVDDSLETSRTRPPADPGTAVGKSPDTVAPPDGFSAATCMKLRILFPLPDGSTTSVVPTIKYVGSAVHVQLAETFSVTAVLPYGFKNATLNLSLSSLSFA